MPENRAKDVIYLDYQATTPCDPRVVEAMLPYFAEHFGNPHSIEHAYGWDAAEAVEKARGELAVLLKAEPREVIFTSGATEANNLAIKGAARFLKDRRPHLVIAETEHKCVLESAKRLEREGHPVTWLPVRTDGIVDLAELEAAVTEETALVSIMAVNNEIGVIQPLAEIGAICREKGALFHTLREKDVVPGGVHVAPADVRNVETGLAWGEFHDVTGDQVEAFMLPVFLTGRGKQLHAKANAQDWHLVLEDALANGGDQALFAQGPDPFAEGANAGKHQHVRLGDVSLRRAGLHGHADPPDGVFHRA